MNAHLNAAVAPAEAAFLDDVVSGRIVLPSIPRVVRKLVVGLRRSDVSVTELATDLAQDPVLAARVLRLANSPYYGGRRSLASIGDAVAVVGTQALQTLVITCGVASAFVQVPAVNLRQFWLEAAVAAAAAQALGRETGADADAAHAAALLADAGHLILCQSHRAKATAVFTRHRNLRGAELAALEREHFGLAHPVVGALWVERLGFPSAVGAAIASYLDEAATDEPLAALVRVGRSIAAAVSDGESVATLLARLEAQPQLPDALRARLAAPGFAERYARLADVPAFV